MIRARAKTARTSAAHGAARTSLARMAARRISTREPVEPFEGTREGPISQGNRGAAVLLLVAAATLPALALPLLAQPSEIHGRITGEGGRLVPIAIPDAAAPGGGSLSPIAVEIRQVLL